MRMREFEQMELQFFVRPGTELEWYNKWKESRLKWHLAIGGDPSKYRYHDHVKLAHYANAAVDIEYEFPFGFKEVEGIHSRTDFRSEDHTSELQSLMLISYAVFCLKKKNGNIKIEEKFAFRHHDSNYLSTSSRHHHPEQTAQ